jgi:DNA-binding response OmpR family regulator
LKIKITHKFKIPERRELKGIRLAILDNDPKYLDLIAAAGRYAGYSCHTFSNARQLLRNLRQESYDLLLVDWKLPSMSGPKLIAEIIATQADARHFPIIIVTHQTEEHDIVSGLISGADDYIAKPVRMNELAARICALLRRSHPTDLEEVLVHGPYKLSKRTNLFEQDGEALCLTNKEFALAWRLFSRIGTLLSRQDLIENIWGIKSDINTRRLDTCVCTLRQKMNLRSSASLRIRSIYSIGYRLESHAALIKTSINTIQT